MTPLLKALSLLLAGYALGHDAWAAYGAAGAMIVLTIGIAINEELNQ